MSDERIGFAVTGPPSRHPDLLAEAVVARGRTVVHVGWDDPTVDWSSFDVVVVRSAAGYLERHGEFLAWAERSAMVTEMWNPVELLRWNVHRDYLVDLAGRGVAVMPTRIVRADDRVLLAELGEAEGWPRLVLKPATTAGTLGVRVVDIADAASQGELEARQRFGDVVVQPYAPAVHTEGELRIALVAGRAVAAVQRFPAGDDFGVQANRMTGTREVTPPDAAVAVAADALAALGRRTLHGRADLLQIDGTWRLVEFELVEPERMLHDIPASFEALVDAVDALTS